jgi:hypothetical protein
MDKYSRPDRVVTLSKDEHYLLKTRIIETCKHNNTDFTINSEQLVDNINFLFSTNYTKEITNVL